MEPRGARRNTQVRVAPGGLPGAGAKAVSVPAKPQSLLAQLEETGALTLRGLQLPPGITFEQYEALGGLLHVWDETRRWAVGDWLIQGHHRFGDAFYQASEVLGISVRSRQQYMRVSEMIPQLRRRVPELRWSHHRAVASLPPEEQDLWLEEAIQKHWTKQELEEAVKGIVPEPPPLAFQPTGYVVERVLSAAEQVYASATRSDNADYYRVESRAIHNLADALGIADDEEAV